MAAPGAARAARAVVVLDRLQSTGGPQPGSEASAAIFVTCSLWKAEKNGYFDILDGKIMENPLIIGGFPWEKYIYKWTFQ